MTAITSNHITKVESVGKRFVLVCMCGWQSGEKDTRAAARNAGMIHRLNAKVQVM